MPPVHLKRTVAIDFDGVLSHYEGWKGVDALGHAVPRAIDLVNNLLDAGHDVIVFTTRTNTEVNCDHTSKELCRKVEDWLKREGFPEELKVYSLPGKPIADLYIDDRAYRHRTNATWYMDEIVTILKLLEE